MNTSLVFIVFISFMVIQSLGAFLQVRQFRKTIKSMHKNNNLAIGGKKRFFIYGEFVIITCDNAGVISEVKTMQGMSIFCRFKNNRNLIGKNIYEVYDKYIKSSKNKKGRYEAYLQALNVLKNRIETQSN